MENSDSSALSDGAQQANLVSNENAEAMFGADQGETNMVKLVDGKLTSIGDTEDDVVDGQLANRYSSDEERSLQGDQLRGKTYENSDSALYADEGIDDKAIPSEPNVTSSISEADITGNPDAGSTVNTGLPSEDEPEQATPTNSFGGWNFIVDGNPVADMIPSTPGAPDPLQPGPGVPETPPTPPMPGPEIPELPGTQKPGQPEIQEPDQPDRSHEINSGSPRHRSATANYLAYTADLSGLIDENDVAPDEALPNSQFEGPDDEGMEEKPDTGDAAHPYDVNAKDADQYQPGERPEEAKEAKKFPAEMTDESSTAAQDMISGPDRSDQKSTEGLDRKYNDPEAARDMAS